MTIRSSIEEAVGREDFAAVLTLCNELELEEHAAPPQDRSAMFVSVHLMAYYIANDRLNARYLWKRTPIDLKENAEVAAAWEVGKAMWARDSGRVHAALDAFAWSDPLVSALVPALKENIRARTLKLLATAYSSLSVDAAKTHLGVDTDDCLKRCAGAGWTLDDANSILTPAVGGNSAVSQKTGIEQIEQLSTYVSYLERQPIGTEPAAAAEMAEKE